MSIALHRARHVVARLAGMPLCAAIACATLLCAAIPSTALGPTNTAEFTLRHDETIVYGEPFDTYSDEGYDASEAPTMITGFVDGQYGTHELTAAAFSETKPDGNLSLKAWSRHVFDVSGENASHHIWEAFQSDVVASAGVSDEVSVNAPVANVELRFFFRVTGYDESDADINPPDGPIADLYSEVRLVSGVIQCRAKGPQSVEAKLVGAKGRLKEDLEVKQVHLKEGRVELKVICAAYTSSLLAYGMVIHSHTFMINDGDERNLGMVGSHGSYFEQSAELIGVVIEDLDGNILPDATIDSASGYTYPILDAVPPEPVPEWTVLSPTAVLGTDLGTYSAEVPLENTINHSGIEKPFTSGESDWDAYFDIEPEPFGNGYYANNWQSDVVLAPPVEGTIDFDFGDDYHIAEIVFWNRTLEDVRLLFALDSDGTVGAGGERPPREPVRVEFLVSPGAGTARSRGRRTLSAARDRLGLPGPRERDVHLRDARRDRGARGTADGRTPGAGIRRGGCSAVGALRGPRDARVAGSACESACAQTVHSERRAH